MHNLNKKLSEVKTELVINSKKENFPYPYNVDLKYITSANIIISKLIDLGVIDINDPSYVLYKGEDDYNIFPIGGVIGAPNAGQFRGFKIYNFRNWVYYYERTDVNGVKHLKDPIYIDEKLRHSGEIVLFGKLNKPYVFEDQYDSIKWVQNQIIISQNIYPVIGRLDKLNYNRFKDYIFFIQSNGDKIEANSLKFKNSYDVLKYIREISFIYERYVPSNIDSSGNIEYMGLGSNNFDKFYSNEFLDLSISGKKEGIPELRIATNEKVMLREWFMRSNLVTSVPNWISMNQNHFDLLLNALSDSDLDSLKINRNEILEKSYSSLVMFKTDKIRRFDEIVDRIHLFANEIGNLYRTDRGQTLASAAFFTMGIKGGKDPTEFRCGAFKEVITNFIKKVYGLESISLFWKNQIKNLVHSANINIFHFTYLLLHTESLISLLFNGDSKYFIQWQKSVSSNVFEHNNYPALDILPSWGTFEWSLYPLGTSASFDSSLIPTISDLQKISSGNVKYLSVKLLNQEKSAVKRDLIIDLPTRMSKESLISKNSEEMSVILSKLTKDSSGNYFFTYGESRYLIFSDNFVRSVGSVPKSQLSMIDFKGESHYFILDAFARGFLADYLKFTSAYEVLDQLDDEYLYNKEIIDEILFFRCIPKISNLKYAQMYDTILMADGGIGKISPLIERENEIIVDQICLRLELQEKSRFEIVKELPLKAKEWISDSQVLFGKYEYKETDSLQIRKGKLAIRIANELGFFNDPNDGKWKLMTNKIESGKSVYINLEFFWFLASHVDFADLHIMDLKQYQNRFKEILEDFLIYLDSQTFEKDGVVLPLFHLYQSYLPRLAGDSFRENLDNFIPWSYFFLIRFPIFS